MSVLSKSFRMNLILKMKSQFQRLKIILSRLFQEQDSTPKNLESIYIFVRMQSSIDLEFMIN